MRNSKILAVIIFILTFAFWFLLANGNYFHWDEWRIFSNFNQPLGNFLFHPYGEHFIPLNFLHYYLLFSVFGLNYIPFQFSVSFFHAVNTVLLFVLILNRTKKLILSTLLAIIFGLANVPIENLVWSLGINYVLAGFCVFLANLFFIRKNYLVAAVLLFISPLFHDITILFPLAFLHISKDRKAVIIFSLMLFINLLLLFSVSKTSVLINTPMNISIFWKIPIFVTEGIIYGTILKFLVPHFYLFHPVFSKIRIILAIFSVFIYSVYLHRFISFKKIFTPFLKILPFLMVSYLSAAPARVAFGLGAPIISRYSYIPLFFFILFIAEIWPKKNFVPQWLTALIFLIFISVQVLANINFSYSYWKPMVARDRQFITDLKTLFNNSERVANYPVPGMSEKILLSDFSYLLPKNSALKFVVPGTSETKNPITQEIYQKMVNEYSRKFD